jgi:hypothetical protein
MEVPFRKSGRSEHKQSSASFFSYLRLVNETRLSVTQVSRLLRSKEGFGGRIEDKPGEAARQRGSEAVLVLCWTDLNGRGFSGSCKSSGWGMISDQWERSPK